MTWGDRTYPAGCANLSAFYTDLYYNGSVVGATEYWVQVGFDTISVKNAQPGEYTLWVWPEWGNGTIHEVNIRVTASEEV